LYYCYWINGKFFVDMTRYRIQVVIDTLLQRKNNSFTMQLSVPLEPGDEEALCLRAEGFLEKILAELSSDFLP